MPLSAIQKLIDQHLEQARKEIADVIEELDETRRLEEDRRHTVCRLLGQNISTPWEEVHNYLRARLGPARHEPVEAMQFADALTKAQEAFAAEDAKKAETIVELERKLAAHEGLIEELHEHIATQEGLVKELRELCTARANELADLAKLGHASAWTDTLKVLRERLKALETHKEQWQEIAEEAANARRTLLKLVGTPMDFPWPVLITKVEEVVRRAGPPPSKKKAYGAKPVQDDEALEQTCEAARQCAKEAIGDAETAWTGHSPRLWPVLCDHEKAEDRSFDACHRRAHNPEIQLGQRPSPSKSYCYLPGLGLIRECEGCGCLVADTKRCNRCAGDKP